MFSDCIFGLLLASCLFTVVRGNVCNQPDNKVVKICRGGSLRSSDRIYLEAHLSTADGATECTCTATLRKTGSDANPRQLTFFRQAQWPNCNYRLDMQRPDIRGSFECTQQQYAAIPFMLNNNDEVNVRLTEHLSASRNIKVCVYAQFQQGTVDAEFEVTCQQVISGGGQQTTTTSTTNQATTTTSTFTQPTTTTSTTTQPPTRTTTQSNQSHTTATRTNQSTTSSQTTTSTINPSQSPTQRVTTTLKPPGKPTTQSPRKSTVDVSRIKGEVTQKDQSHIIIPVAVGVGTGLLIVAVIAVLLCQKSREENRSNDGGQEELAEPIDSTDGTPNKDYLVEDVQY